MVDTATAEDIDLDELDWETVDSMIEAESDTNDGETLATVDDKAETATTETTGEPEPKETNADAGTDKADGIATKDGKNIIPYEVLETTRQEALKERQARIDAENKLAEMTKAATQAESGEETNIDSDMLLSKEEMDALEQEYPTLGKAFRLQQEKLQHFQKQFDDDKQTKEKDETETARKTVQDHIDNIPELAYAQSNDADMFDKLIQFDAMLLKDPKYSDMETRFKKSVEMYEQSFGKILPATTTTQEKTPEKEVKQQQPQKQTKPTVTSMSDIPGGAQVPVDEKAQIETMNAVEMENMFANWTPEQIEDYLNANID